MIYYAVLGYSFEEKSDRPIETTFVRDPALAMQMFEDDSTALDAVALYAIDLDDDIDGPVASSAVPRLIRQFGSLPRTAHPATLGQLIALCGAEHVS
jgi:hypothetical protein